MGIAYNEVPSLTVDFGAVQHTENGWSDHSICPGYTSGVETLDLSYFPLDDLPSGGSSSRISPGEMFLVKITSYGPVLPKYITQQWVRADGSQMFKTNFDVQPQWENVMAYSFLGHFSWEITKPGTYTCNIVTDLGKAAVQFYVTDSTPASGSQLYFTTVTWS